MLAVGEHLVLPRQEGAAGIDEIEARKTVLARDLLCAQVLLDGHREVGAALYGRVVGDDDAFAAFDPPDAGDDAGARRRVVVHAVRRELRQFEKGRARIEQRPHARARQQLAAPRVAFARPRAAALLDGRDARTQIRHLGGDALCVVAKLRRARIERAVQHRHAPLLPSPASGVLSTTFAAPRQAEGPAGAAAARVNAPGGAGILGGDGRCGRRRPGSKVS